MLHMERIDGKNVWDLLDLKVRKDQTGFVADNARSLIEAYVAITNGAHAFPFGLYDGDTPVGFLMVGYGAEEDWDDAPEIARENYSLWRLMIDQRFQGRGYGREAVRLALDFIGTRPCGEAACCWLSYRPENAAAKALYHAFSFRETGELDGEEVIAVRPLERR